MILLPLVAVVALTDKTSSEQTSARQLVAQFATVLMVGCLLLAETRSAWLGTFAGVVTLGTLVLMCSDRSGDVRAQKHKLVLPGILTIIVVSFVLIIGFQNQGIVRRATSLSNVSGIYSWQARLYQWRATVEMIKQRPVFGVGIGQYPLIQHNYTQIGAQLSNDGLNGTRNSLAEQVHNLYLQTTAEVGLPALLLMGAVMAAFFVAALSRVREMDSGIRRSSLMASVASMVAFAVDAFASPSWQVGQVSIFFWLMLGVGISTLRPWTSFAEEPTSKAKRSR